MGSRTSRSRAERRRQRRGVALVYALFAAAAAATMIAVTMSVAVSSNEMTQLRQYGGEARYLADGAIEQAKHDISDAVANWRAVPTNGTANIDGTLVPYTVTPTAFSTITTDAAGIQTIVTGYEVEARAAVMNHSSTMHRLVNTEATPVFQFAVFYTDDLEINPGPSMLLGGRVHTNSDMYLNCGGTLTVNTNYLRAVGSIYRNRKDDPSLSEGIVDVRNWVLNPFDIGEPSVYAHMNSLAEMTALGITTTSGYDSRVTTSTDLNHDGDFLDPYEFAWGPGALAYWAQPTNYTGGTGNTVMTGIHGIGKAAVPHIGSIKMFEPVTGGSYYFDNSQNKYVLATQPGQGTHEMGYYHAQADLSIITYWNNGVPSTVAYDKSGNDITASLTNVLTQTSMYDTRQANGGAGSVPLTQIDLAQLSALGKWPANGLLYAAHYGAGTGTNAKGVRLINGSNLPGKLTVVSENSLYIKGNFNTVQKKGAAVIADAINLLSNAWDDTKASGASSAPTATNTTYNVAMITGNTNTVPGGQYNGGLENLPRFHEKWTGKTCKITGSFVNTWTSQFATGNWVLNGNYYNAPIRDWNYDARFNQVNNLPPFTPMAVTAVDVAAW